MALFIYNTLNKTKEEFKTLVDGQVSMYVCGVTVYDECHLGHARALINFDVIYRYLKLKGYKVHYARNFTDVDDKIINRANQENIPWNEVSEKYIATFRRDMKALGVLTPNDEPKATENIQAIIDMIKTLEAKGFAYHAGADVFYSVRKKADYGKLSGKKIEDLESGARIEIHEQKKDPLDFALWKASKPGEPAWDSPWGPGRPGWHIECSAMSTGVLGETFDIHGGGRDLSFPHHENEIAQSEAATGKPFARYWIHNGFVNINAEKMSKSLGNFLKIQDVLNQYQSEVIRCFVLSAHYGSPLDYTDQNMENSRLSLCRWYSTLQRIADYGNYSNDSNSVSQAFLSKLKNLKTDFENAMDDDFNTAKSLGLLFDLAREWNKVLDSKKPVPMQLKESFFKDVENIHSVLGIFGSDSLGFINLEKQKILTRASLKEVDVLDLVEKRKTAKALKNWAEADSIRNNLAQKGIYLKDNSDGTTTWGVG